MASTQTERGFSLLELLVCMAILIVAGAATIGAFAAVARNAQPDRGRALAAATAENLIVRARAAVAYVPAASGDPVGDASRRTWALRAGSVHTSVRVELRGPGPCGAGVPLAVALPVDTTYDDAAARFTVAVGYPRDPCSLAPDGTIPAGNVATLERTVLLPPSTFAPGTVVTQHVAVPENQ